MAVEARPMNLLPSQFITNREFVKPNNDNQMATAPLESGGFPLYQSDWGSGKAESGLTSGNFPAAPAPKRTRRSVYDEPAEALFHQQMIVNNSQIHHQHSEIDRFIAIHTEKMRMEMEERKKRQWRMLVWAIEERVVKKLKEKEEEIERMGKLNWVLQERVKRLWMENQLWRDLAHTNEATVNSLRTDLEQILLANNNNNNNGGTEEAQTAEDDAESSCGSCDSGGGGEGRCRKCGAGEARVLVLPCRHLCLCTMCGSALHNCPVCNSAINASVHVNFS